MINIIVAGGSIDIQFAKNFIEGFSKEERFIIACDKGFNSCDLMEIRPDMVIGDFDSAKDGTYIQVKSRGINLILLNSEKDDTDSEAAVNYILNSHERNGDIYILGATGTRLDHVLGNISLVALGAAKGRNITLLDSHNKITAIPPASTITIDRDLQFGKYISVFPYMGVVTGLTMTGFKYPLDKVRLEGFNTLTVSNEIVDNQAMISTESGYLIIMETKD